MQEKSLIKKNILQYIEYKNISKYKLYQKTGITRGVLDQNNGMSEENTARFIAEYGDVNTEWLLTGKGEMLKTATSAETIHGRVDNSQNKRDKHIYNGYVEQMNGGVQTINNNENRKEIKNYHGMSKEELVLLINNMAQDYLKSIEERYRHLQQKDAQIQEKDQQIAAINKQVDDLIAECKRLSDKIIELMEKVLSTTEFKRVS